MNPLLLQIVLTTIVFSIIFHNRYPFTEVWRLIRAIIFSIVWILTAKDGWRHVKRFWDL
jgi:hypothetical protein